METVDYGLLLDEIEIAKGKERMSLGGKGGIEMEGVPAGAPLQKGKVRDIVAEKLGMGRTNYECAKYIAKKAPPEIIDEIDKGKRSIRGTYDELKAKEKVTKAYEPEVIEVDEESDNDSQQDNGSESGAATTPIVSTTEKAEKTVKSTEIETIKADEESEDDSQEDNSLESGAVTTSAVNLPTVDPPKPNVPPSVLSKADQEAEARNVAFNALSPQKKVVELQRQLKEERARAANAESELARLKELRHNDVFHKDGIINNLKTQLANAEARIKELEKKYCAD